MKKQLTSFLAGTLVTTLIFALSISALASVGAFDITVSPIDLLVNGNVFQPKDVNGKDVMVFVYEGTTYAPVRALAEAYGLEVGYDSGKNLATVSQPGSEPLELTGAYRGWQNAQSAPESGDVYRDLVKAKEQIEEGLKSYKVGTEKYLASVEVLIPKNSQDDAAEYLTSTLNRYLTEDSVGVSNFIYDLLAEGIMIQTGDWVNIAPGSTLEEICAKLKITPELARAIFDELEEYDHEYEWSYEENDDSENKLSDAVIEDIKHISIPMVKMGDKYYLSEHFVRTGVAYNYSLVTQNNQTSLFNFEDISVNGSGHSSSWLLNYILQLAFLEEYTVEATENPNVDGVLIIKEPSPIDDCIGAGSGAMEYITATETYTPQWIEYNGKRIYNLKTRESGLRSINGIRYFNNEICINDILDYWGVDKTIEIGLYKGGYYVEVK